MARTLNALKNITTIWLEKFIVIILSFILRTVFIYTLGVQYVGVDGLFTNVLSLLSLSELGIGVAMTYSMYKPVAENNQNKLLSIMSLYKKVYRIIAAVIFSLGILLLPFLRFMIKEPPTDINIYLVYFGFLLDVSLSYLFTYKRSMLVAHQKTYKFTIIDTVAKVLLLTIQSVVLLIFHNYYFYLIAKVIGNLIENAIVSAYVTSVYPYLKRRDVSPLDQTEKDSIMSNVKAMFFHKFGDFAINSTDNLIISAFINLTTVGIVSNYNLIISGINTFINNAFSSLSAGIGNFIIQKDHSKNVEMIEVLNFLAFWIYGFASVCFYHLLNPFIQLWIGPKFVLPMITVALIVFSQFLTGMRVPLSTFKSAAGIFKQDQFIPLIQAVVNLVISVIAVQTWGLPGIYLGTICSSVFVASWNRPYTVYKYALNISSKSYFKKYAVYLVFVTGVIAALSILFSTVKIEDLTIQFVLKLIMCITGYNVPLLILFKNTREFRKLISLVKSIIQSRRKFIYE